MGRVEDGLRWRVLVRDGFRCAYCGRTAAEDGVAITVDHLIPVVAGGLDRPDNLVAACHDCNTGKGDSLLADAELAAIKSRITTEPVYDAKYQPRYGDDILEWVRDLRRRGYGYKKIARVVCVSRDTARDLVRRAERAAA